MKTYSQQIRFESPAALREEFEKNIAKRGIFIATAEEFEVRQSIVVEIVLAYVDDSEIVLTLRGEVVHCIPIEMASSGVVPGIAVQFDDSATALREVFEPLLGRSVTSDLDVDKEGSARRSSKREPVRVPVRIMPHWSPPFETTSRDLSATGILLTSTRVELPVGEFVRTCLRHPSGEPSIEIDGQVVREVRDKKGRLAAVAVAFDRSQAAHPQVGEVIEALRQAGHRGGLGGVSGEIADIGLRNLLQMYGSSAPQGTLIVERDGEQGWIAFAEGQLLGAALGALSGHDALVAMLDWGDGRFRFEPSADDALIAAPASSPLRAAVMKAESALAGLGRAISDETIFDVDIKQEQASRLSLDKIEGAVLELARSGLPLGKLEAIIPEPADEIQAALENLIELGVLRPR